MSWKSENKTKEKIYDEDLKLTHQPQIPFIILKIKNKKKIGKSCIRHFGFNPKFLILAYLMCTLMHKLLSSHVHHAKISLVNLLI